MVRAISRSICVDIKVDWANFHECDKTVVENNGHICFKSSQGNILDGSIVLVDFIRQDLSFMAIY